MSPAQLAVLWCKDQPGITAPLVGVGSVEHLEDLIPVMDMTLERLASRRLRRACSSWNKCCKLLEYVGLDENLNWLRKASEPRCAE